MHAIVSIITKSHALLLCPSRDVISASGGSLRIYPLWIREDYGNQKSRKKYRATVSLSNYGNKKLENKQYLFPNMYPKVLGLYVFEL